MPEAKALQNRFETLASSLLPNIYTCALFREALHKETFPGKSRKKEQPPLCKILANLHDVRRVCATSFLSCFCWKPVSARHIIDLQMKLIAGSVFRRNNPSPSLALEQIVGFFFQFSLDALKRFLFSAGHLN